MALCLDLIHFCYLWLISIQLSYVLFYLCLLLFLVTALFVVAFQPYVVWIPIFLIYKQKHVPDQIYIKMINSFVFLSTFYSPIRWVISSKANSETLPSLLLYKFHISFQCLYCWIITYFCVIKVKDISQSCGQNSV